MTHGHKNIHNMKLHDISEDVSPFNDATMRVTRVPGGWIYTHTGDRAESSVFVPFTKELS